MVAMSKKIIAKSGGQLQPERPGHFHPEKGGQFHPEKAGVLIRNIHMVLCVFYSLVRVSLLQYWECDLKSRPQLRLLRVTRSLCFLFSESVTWSDTLTIEVSFFLPPKIKNQFNVTNIFQDYF